jgi:dTDP-4-amino-4,6-dideoxygalactose transaminase
MTTLAVNGGTPVRSRPFPPQNTIGAEERAAVHEVLDTGVLSGFIAAPIDEHLGGPRVRACEEAFARRLGAAHAVAVNSATTGLSTAVAAAGIAPGDEVIVSPYTMSASAACVLMHNAIPVFADIEPETFNLDPASVEANLSESTAAIMLIHLFGHPAPMDGILEIAERKGLAVIEDAAQSIGATWRGRETGTLGTVGVLSLNRHKIIQSGEGGIVITDDDEVAGRARLVRNHGEVSVDALGLELANAIGSNFRMTEIEAAIATEQVAKLDALLEIRRELAAHLTRRLADLPGVVPAVVKDDCTHSYYVYPVKLDAEELRGVGRRAFCEALAAEGVPNEPGYAEPIYLQSVYQQRIARGPRGCPWTCGHWKGSVSYERGICPVTERMYDEELLLLDVTRAPLTTRDIDDVADAFEKVLACLDDVRDGEA